jgi:hypothetical protein
LNIATWNPLLLPLEPIIATGTHEYCHWNRLSLCHWNPLPPGTIEDYYHRHWNPFHVSVLSIEVGSGAHTKGDQLEFKSYVGVAWNKGPRQVIGTIAAPF